MDYFYCPPENIEGKNLIIDGEEFSHLVHVMRKKEGDEVRVVNGMGMAYDVRLDSVAKKIAKCTITHSHAQHHEPVLSVTLAVAVLKNPSKFDFLVEKVTEIGVKEIIPLVTERTIPHHAKVDRWQKLALAAMKQCGRSYLPRVYNLTALEEIIQDVQRFDHSFVAHEKKLINASTHIERKSRRSVLICIGPEGGFTEDEIERCMNAGCKPIYLGERRLRTETAAILASAISLLS